MFLLVSLASAVVNIFIQGILFEVAVILKRKVAVGELLEVARLNLLSS